MRRHIGQRGLDRQPVDAGAEQRLPEIALNPFSKRSVARTRRVANDCSPSTTATSLRPSRVALATTLNPDRK